MTARRIRGVGTDNKFEVSQYPRYHDDKVKRRTITRPVELDRAKSTDSTVSVPSKRKASVNPRKTHDTELKIVGDLLQLVNFRKHGTATAATFQLQKKKRRQTVCLRIIRSNGTSAACAEWIWTTRRSGSNATSVDGGHTSSVVTTWARKSMCVHCLAANGMCTTQM